MLRRVIEKQGDPMKVRKERMSNYPLGRFGEPQEVATTALLLASSESSFVTGAVIVVDGESTARYSPKKS
jgi:NAD(P)-dependent dehydrogenase (short-subunit alcohol dehydrogenase family)